MLFLYHLSLLIISSSALGSGLFRMRLSSKEGAMVKFCYTEWPANAPLRSDKKCFFNQYNFTIHANGHRVISRPFDNAINEFVAFTAIVMNSRGLFIGQVNERIAIDGLGLTRMVTVGGDVEITIGVECAKNLYGPKCMRYCNPKSGDHLQNYICSPLGEKQCNKGWTGIECETQHVQVSHTAAIIFESVTSRRFIIEMGSFILVILVGFLLVLLILNRRVNRLMNDPKTQNAINSRRNISRVAEIDSQDLNKVYIIGTKTFGSSNSFHYNSHYTAEPTDYSVPSCHSSSISTDMSIYDEIDSTGSNSLPLGKASDCKLSVLSFDCLV
uniref:Delta-like protein n=1 Tax=Heterorhabditis bacteriophora TaxID=37862 RepID=A0A1I7XKP4_HETBA